MHETVPTSCDEVLVKLNLIYAHICIFFGALFSDLRKIESREQFMQAMYISVDVPPYKNDGSGRRTFLGVTTPGLVTTKGV